MEFKDIKELIKLVNESKNIGEVSLRNGAQGIKIKKNSEASEMIVRDTPAISYSPPIQEVVSVEEKEIKPAVETGNSTPEKEELHYIKSPMVGTFYASASPDVENYVSEGSNITPDEPVCIVEAMKLFNEIQAEVSGEIVDVLVENGQLVEYGEPLFSVRLNGGAK